MRIEEEYKKAEKFNNDKFAAEICMMKNVWFSPKKKKKKG